MILPFDKHRLFKVLRWSTNSGEFRPGEELNSATLEETKDISQADIVISQHATYADNHMIMLDIDIPAMLLESGTPGHHHLYIDRYVGWEQYVKLLDVLADCGIIERGYAEASKARGFTALRLPWIRK